MRRRQLGSAPPVTQAGPGVATMPAQPVAAPVQPTPAPAPVVAQLMPANGAGGNGAGTTALAVPRLGPDLLQLGAFERQKSLLPASGGGAPYLSFFSTKSPDAINVQRALGQLGEGSPFVKIGEGYVNAQGLAFLILAELPHWVTLDGAFSPNRAWLTPQPFGAKVGNDKVSEQVLTVLLLLPAQAALPQTVAPAGCLATVTTFRATKARAARAHLDAVERSTQPAWAQEAGNGPIAATVPPRFRIASTLVLESKTARSGFSYSAADAVPATISVAQAQAINAWAEHEESQAALQAALESFDRQAERINQLAQETAQGGKR